MAYTMRLTAGRGEMGKQPVNTVLPVITGTPTVGQTLTCSVGGWTGYPPPDFTRQWIRGASTVIPGATGATYVLQGADATNTIKCAVTASNALGVTTATSAATAAVAA